MTQSAKRNATYEDLKVVPPHPPLSSRGLYPGLIARLGAGAENGSPAFFVIPAQAGTHGNERQWLRLLGRMIVRRSYETRHLPLAKLVVGPGLRREDGYGDAKPSARPKDGEDKRQDDKWGMIAP